MILLISSLKMWKSWMSAGMPPLSSRVANWASRSIRAITMFFTLTAGWSSAHASRKLARQARWNSSGKT
jgi:hypothetical protein